VKHVSLHATTSLNVIPGGGLLGQPQKPAL
jgi:hypothetical protein